METSLCARLPGARRAPLPVRAPFQIRLATYLDDCRTSVRAERQRPLAVRRAEAGRGVRSATLATRSLAARRADHDGAVAAHVGREYGAGVSVTARTVPDVGGGASGANQRGRRRDPDRRFGRDQGAAHPGDPRRRAGRTGGARHRSLGGRAAGRGPALASRVERRGAEDGGVRAPLQPWQTGAPGRYPRPSGRQAVGADRAECRRGRGARPARGRAWRGSGSRIRFPRQHDRPRSGGMHRPPAVLRTLPAHGLL